MLIIYTADRIFLSLYHWFYHWLTAVTVLHLMLLRVLLLCVLNKYQSVNYITLITAVFRSFISCISRDRYIVAQLDISIGLADNAAAAALPVMLRHRPLLCISSWSYTPCYHVYVYNQQWCPRPLQLMVKISAVAGILAYRYIFASLLADAFSTNGVCIITW